MNKNTPTIDDILAVFPHQILGIDISEIFKKATQSSIFYHLMEIKEMDDPEKLPIHFNPEIGIDVYNAKSGEYHSKNEQGIAFAPPFTIACNPVFKIKNYSENIQNIKKSALYGLAGLINQADLMFLMLLQSVAAKRPQERSDASKLIMSPHKYKEMYGEEIHLNIDCTKTEAYLVNQLSGCPVDHLDLSSESDNLFAPEFSIVEKNNKTIIVTDLVGNMDIIACCDKVGTLGYSNPLLIPSVLANKLKAGLVMSCDVAIAIHDCTHLKIV